MSTCPAKPKKKRSRKSGSSKRCAERRSRTIALPKWLIGTSLACFLLDIAYYGNTISNQQFVAAVSPHGTQIQNLLVSLLVFTFAAFPGYLLAAYGMDRWGRKTIQILGFALMAASFIGIAFLRNAGSALIAFVILYCLNYFAGGNAPGQRSNDVPRHLGNGRQGRSSNRDVQLSTAAGALRFARSDVDGRHHVRGRGGDHGTTAPQAEWARSRRVVPRYDLRSIGSATGVSARQLAEHLL
jgi:predicted MFS family arabinose efflux permease